MLCDAQCQWDYCVVRLWRQVFPTFYGIQLILFIWKSVSRSVMSDSLWPLPGSSVHGDSPGKNTGVGCHSLLQEIFPTQGSNPGFWSLLHWQVDSLASEPPGKPLSPSKSSHKIGDLFHNLTTKNREVVFPLAIDPIITFSCAPR